MAFMATGSSWECGAVASHGLQASTSRSSRRSRIVEVRMRMRMRRLTEGLPEVRFSRVCCVRWFATCGVQQQAVHVGGVSGKDETTFT